jgi:hypothetical protein
VIAVAVSFVLARPSSKAVSVGSAPTTIHGVVSASAEPDVGLGTAPALPALGSRPPVKKKRVVPAVAPPPVAAAPAEPAPVSPAPPAPTPVAPAPVQPAPAPTPPPAPANPDPAPLQFDDSG